MKTLSQTILLLFTGPVFLSVLLQRIILATTMKSQRDLYDFWGALSDFFPFVVIEVIGVNPCAMAGKEDP